MKIKKPPSVINSTTSTVSCNHKDLSLNIATNKSENTSLSEYYRSYGSVDQQQQKLTGLFRVFFLYPKWLQTESFSRISEIQIFNLRNTQHVERARKGLCPRLVYQSTFGSKSILQKKMGGGERRGRNCGTGSDKIQFQKQVDSKTKKLWPSYPGVTHSPRVQWLWEWLWVSR